jgi:type III pantothenate kinase
MTYSPRSWLALAIGNSRLHWASFGDDTLQQVWQTRHIDQAEVTQLITQQFDFQQCGLWQEAFPLPFWADMPELWITSVVPVQTQIWQHYPAANWITLTQVPIANMYATLGLDRAIALWGAIITYGSPVLVIDGGTALTFTGATGDRLVGGAILPGLQLQFRALGQSTAALPLLDFNQMTDLPPRWALDTPNAIRSGIIYSTIAGVQNFIQDWWQQFPHSMIVFTGGDGACLHQHLQSQLACCELLKFDQQLMFWGMRSVRERRLSTREHRH